ncbi:MAG: hypothetical protein ACHQD8_03050 [Chitinophagales bacterium]
MKKLSLVAAMFALFTSHCFANKIIITAIGDKTGPTTVGSDGTVTFNCSISEATCGKIVIESSKVVEPTKGDPTTVITYIKGQPDAEYSGGFVHMRNERRKEGTIHFITLSDIKGN